MALTEAVTIWSIDPERKLYDGRLVVGRHHLPELTISTKTGCADYEGLLPQLEFPANWELRPADPRADNLLLMAWQTIQDIQAGIAKAENARAMRLKIWTMRTKAGKRTQTADNASSADGKVT